jgi:uncharacterized protein YcnI
MRIRRSVSVLAAAGVFLVSGAGVASAHVHVSSADASPGGYGELTFRVPTESDTASTVKLQVQLPTDTPLAYVGTKPVPGWTATTTTTPLDPPVTDDDGNQVTEAISEVTWTADPGAGIKPGEYQTFSMSVGPLPDSDTMAFPSLQTYDDGTVVSWIDPTVDGQPEPEHPAPVLALSASADGHDAGSTEEAVAGSADEASSTADSGTSGVAVTALVLAIVGVLAGLGGLALGLRGRSRPTT